jgi:hypothetical protein
MLKGGVKVCQRQLVSEVLRPRVTEFACDLGREVATPIQRARRSVSRAVGSMPG